MSRPLRILHIASFSGNIGDNANHMGFRPWFNEQVSGPVSWTNLEIREFFWRERAWNQDLINIINDHDLLVIGGGNYFELWVEDSPTGTSIGLEPEVFEQIRIPVFFNALGVDPGQGVPDVCRQRFTGFLDKILDNDQFLVSVRNDGARHNLARHISVSHAEKVLGLPDHGFFVPPPTVSADGGGYRRVAINLACDMSETRFNGFDSQAEFAEEMAAVVTGLADSFPDTQFCFLPHIFRDLEIISQVIGFLNDRLRRTRLSVSPYGSGDRAANQLLSLYRSASLVLGMRFHANVCPIAFERNVIGLNCYPQIENLFHGLGLEDRIVNVSGPGFKPDILALAERALSQEANPPPDIANAMTDVRQDRSGFERHLKTWLSKNNLSDRTGVTA